MSDTSADFIIIGAGIAGASLAYWLAPHGRVLLLEAESQPGYHSTGRSAALYMPSYGSEQVRGLTRASQDFLQNPPPGFSDYPLLKARGAMMVAGPAEIEALKAHWAMLQALDPKARWLSADEACALLPVLRPEQVAAATLEPDAFDMDVNAIHTGFLRGMRKAGGQLVCNAQVTALQRMTVGRTDVWQVSAGAQMWTAPVVVNAAGAWAEVVGAMAGAAPIGLQPCRRSAFIFTPPAGVQVDAWPMAIGASEDWYMKPDAGAFLGSPANADPVEPHDVQPQELDVALGIHRITEMTTLEIRRPARTWAGLRSFVADGGLVGGFDTRAAQFFWLAAQGGYGIQTCVAMGQACAALVRGQPVPEVIAAQGITAHTLGPARLQDRPPQ